MKKDLLEVVLEFKHVPLLKCVVHERTVDDVHVERNVLDVLGREHAQLLAQVHVFQKHVREIHSYFPIDPAWYVQFAHIW